MYPQKHFFFLIALFLAGLLVACFPAATPDTPDVNTLQTQVAQDIILQLTLTAISEEPTEVADSPTPLPPTPTPTATEEPTQPPTALPTATSIPPTPTPTPLPCNWAEFVRDVTIPDGTLFPPGSEFIKTWRIRNIGTCTWSRDYDLVFIDGSRMGGSREVSLPDIVLPGETIDISVRLNAPEDDGTYRGNWALRDEDGEIFGVGRSGQAPVWVLVQVVEGNQSFAYDFVSNLCLAFWESREGDLPCPGDEDSDDGFVRILDNPRLENRFENEPAIWSVPDRSSNGWISGEYPEIRVRNGYHFRTWVGCLDDSKGCNVVFSLEYRIDGGRINTLESWPEVYDGQVTEVNLDLSDLSGEDVSFILTVEVEEGPNKANPFWFVPRIVDVDDD